MVLSQVTWDQQMTSFSWGLHHIFMAEQLLVSEEARLKQWLWPFSLKGFCDSEAAVVGKEVCLFGKEHHLMAEHLSEGKAGIDSPAPPAKMLLRLKVLGKTQSLRLWTAAACQSRQHWPQWPNVLQAASRHTYVAVCHGAVIIGGKSPVKKGATFTTWFCDE